MATVVWHGFQSCSSNQQQKAVELVPPMTALRLKLAPQKPADQLHSLSSLNTSTYDFTPPTRTTDYYYAKGENEAYAPSQTPVVKVKLSEKSLEMCTENLGCETGSSDVIIHPSFMSSVVVVNDDDGGKCESPTTVTRKNTRQQSMWRGGRGSFPPPLTTMRSGGEGVVVVRSHRTEQGRLVMDAVKCPYSSRSNFVTHRTHGRLRLTLLLPQYSTHHQIGSNDEEDAQLDIINTPTTPTLVNQTQFPHQNFLDLNTIPQQNHHPIAVREQELEEEEEEEETESTAERRFLRLQPTMSRCMDAGGGEHKHHHPHHHHHRHHHHHHHTKHFINIRLNWPVATS